MKIVLSAQGDKGLEEQIDSRFGRCPFFVFVEVDKDKKEIIEHKTIKNESAEQFGGAGTTSTQFVVNKGAKAVISPNIGPKAFQVLNQLGIEIYQGQGKVEDVVQEFLKGNLNKINQATGPSYMGK
jgi:predicted Fe-Mo cluster-binding NifX family protein